MKQEIYVPHLTAPCTILNRSVPNQTARLVVLSKFAKDTVWVWYGTLTFFMNDTVVLDRYSDSTNFSGYSISILIR